MWGPPGAQLIAHKRRRRTRAGSTWAGSPGTIESTVAPPHHMPQDDSSELLERWFGGDRAALRELVERNQDWVKARVRARLGQRLRKAGESDDYVQEAMLDFLEYSPRFRVETEGQLRGLLARIVENTIRDQHDYWFQARRRTLSREQPVSSETVLDLSPRANALTPPDEKTAKREMDALLRMAVELLDPEDRRVVVLRHWDDLAFGAIAEQVGISADGARKRYERALPKLARMLSRLKRGELE